MIVDVPEWYIRRDIFDIRSVQYFLESFGVEFFEEIPLKYQVAIVKNLNKLIKYKSSERNNNDIIDLFNLTGTYIYKYFLYKKKDEKTSSTDIDKYDLEFIKVKQGDSFDKYIDDNIYRYKYDDLTMDDKYWDGVYKEWNNESDKTFKEKLHEEIRDEHIKDVDFTVEGTKYMSIDYEVDMSKYKYQVEYFFNYLLDSQVDSNDVRIIVPSINMDTEVTLSGVFILLYLLSLSYDDIPDKVIRPFDRSSHQLNITTPRVEYYDQLYTDDGDYDDYLKWNKIFGEYRPPAHFDTHQFDFGGVIRSGHIMDDDQEFEFGDISYNLDYLQGDYDFEEMLDPPDIEGLYDFNNPEMHDGTEPETTDYGLYDFGIVEKITPLDDDKVFDFYDIEDPDTEYIDYDFDDLVDEEPLDEDDGWDFMHPLYSVPSEWEVLDSEWDFNDLADLDPDEFWRQFFHPKHWEGKTYIENQDPEATAEGYNSYEVWAENYLDWAKRRVPETLETSYDRVFGFNNALEPQDIEDFLEVIERRIKPYNFEKGYTGYSYKTVLNNEGDVRYYEITYEYDELVYDYDEYIQYVNPDGDLNSYNDWVEDQKYHFLLKNPRGPLGIAGFRIVKKLDTVEDIMENFDINTECYNDLRNRIMDSDNRDENLMLNYVFRTLCTRQFDYHFYEVGNEVVQYISQVLKDKSYILYNFYNQLISETNVEARKNNIRSVMNDIIGTLEYYITGDNVEFIYSAFTISSFSALLHYLYLMINFFKSWKVYFLDPVVTINTNDRLENGNNYGSGIDSLAEIKLNYWHEDKEFKEDTISVTGVHQVDERYNEVIKEVLDVYGHFDPDPEDDYDYDGYTVEEASAEYKDANGGVVDASLNIPYKMINGGKSYDKLLDIWDLDGAGPLEMQDYLRVDGGGAYHADDLVTRNSFDNLYTFMINGGSAGTNQFWTKSMHTRVIDRQIEQKALVSDQDGNVIIEKEDGLYLQQAWASWKEFDDIRSVGDRAFEYINYVMEVLYDDLVVVTDDQLLTQRINELVADELSDMRKVANYVDNIEHQENVYKQYIDKYIEDLTDEIGKFSPYTWEEF
jgi:hypothetical protein